MGLQTPRELLPNHNGANTNLFQFALKNMGANPEQVIWEIPISQILLDMRETLFQKSENKGFQLTLMEAIDGG